MATTSVNGREILVALPGATGDIYRQHQMVWDVIQYDVQRGRDFIYAMTSPHLARVRSPHLARGTVSAMRDGPMIIDLVTAKRNGQRMSALASDEAIATAITLLKEGGIRAQQVEILEQANATGTKHDRHTGRAMTIALPVSRISFHATTMHQAKANLAWINGIGRAKRFGYGMLRSV